MGKVQEALALAGYHHTARFLREATVDDLRLARDIVTRQIETVEADADAALCCAEALLEIDREIGRMV